MQSTILRLAALAAVLTPLAIAQNDDCTGALPVLDGANGPFTNVGATTSTPAWPCGSGANDIWFVYVATASGTYDVNLCGGSYDSTLEVFDGTAGCAALVSLGCNDDSCGTQSRVTFTATLGATYYIRMGGYAGATGTAPLTIVPPAPPIPNTLTTTFFSDNGGSVGGGVYFDLNVLNPAGLTLNSIDVNLNEVANTVGTIEVYYIPGTSRTGNEANPAAWTLAATGSVTSAGVDVASAVTLTAPIPLAPGLHGFAYKAIGVSHAYTNGTGSNQNFANADISLAGGEASNVAFTAPIFTPRIVNTRLYYSIGSAGTVAVQQSYGAGCYASYASFYEHFLTTASIDLSNTAFQLVNTGTGYLALPSTTAFVTPSATATNLNLSDDSETIVTLSATLPYPGGTTTSLNVCSNGHISTATNGAAFDYTPTPAEMLNWANASWTVWHDMIPNTAGNVWFEEVGGIAIITWLNVVGYQGQVAGTTPSTFQLQFNLTTGNVDYVFQSLDTVSVSGWTGGDGWLVGYSPAGASQDPGNVDLTAALPTAISLGLTDTAPLALTAGARPIGGTVVPLTLSNIPGPSLGLVVLSFGAVVPGLDLGYLGMPGCTQHIALGGAVTLGAVVGNGSIPLSIPTDPFYFGFNVFAQGAALVSGVNPLGGLASNGVRLVFGNL
jgi:hypothetical protein